MKLEMNKAESIKKHTEQMAKHIEYVYSDGYSAGYSYAKEEFGSHERVIAKCKRATMEQIEKFGTELYGWCTECEKALEGRWVSLINFCPWCGRVIEWNNRDSEE